jgi:N6-adenosine-specific RNA methylase IME4
MTEKYLVILADPPWPYATYSAKGKGRSAEAHYSTMSIEDIAALPVGNWAADDSALLLWVTKPIAPRGYEVIKAWGFEYKTVAFTWVKTLAAKDDVTLFGPPPLRFHFGMGHWTRSNPEQCLLATRGKPHRLNANVEELILAPRRGHSVKPDETYARIERLLAGPYLELFARQRRPGWDVAFSPEADSGPGARRWGSSSYPGAAL